ncbi:hypothetical protein J1614_004882 [Plenodomus biglobosus]|nr:hypothetical protein J1614_004882 [Plenodomus biglobosus]
MSKSNTPMTRPVRWAWEDSHGELNLIEDMECATCKRSQRLCAFVWIDDPLIKTPNPDHVPYVAPKSESSQSAIKDLWRGW